MSLKDRVTTAFHAKVLHTPITDERTEKFKTILHSINLRFYPGQFTAIMGSSGCGKTTLLSLMAARLRFGYVKGDISLRGRPVGAWAKRSIGYVAQEDCLNPLDTPAEVISFAASCTRPGFKHPEIVD